MATDKRERQRQNRAAKEAELNKQQRRQVMIDRSKRVALWVAIFVVLVIVSQLVWG